MMVARELKICAILVNILILLVGGALVGVGVFVMLDNHGMIKLNRINEDGVYTDSSTPGLLDVAGVLTIIIGCLSFLMALHGVCSVCGEWRCMLALYIGGLIMTMLLEGATIGSCVVFTIRIDDHLYNATYQGIRNQFEGHIVTDNSFSKAFDEAQVEFECCGLNNYTDFGTFSLSWIDKDSLQIPKTCCVLDKGKYFDNDEYDFTSIDCARLPTQQTAHIEKGCYTDIKDWLDKMAYLLLGMSIVGAGATFLGLMVAICLIRDVGDGSSKKPI